MEGNKAATRLTVAITEDASGDFDVQYEAVDLQSGKRVPMRMSHIVGQLHQAANMLSVDYYGTLKAQIASKVKAEISGKANKKR